MSKYAKKTEYVSEIVKELMHHLPLINCQRLILDIEPGNCENLGELLSKRYDVYALINKNTDMEKLRENEEWTKAAERYKAEFEQKRKRRCNSLPGTLTIIEGIESLPEIQFDGVVAIHALIDLPPDEKQKLVEYIIQHTKPGGYVAITTRPNSNLFSGWEYVRDSYKKQPIKSRKRTKSLDLALVIEQLLRKPRI
ncbi:class I SAM-dependent methyltransferase [Candidatus Woesearchaeota archaeon]|nr:class I SAM-dependent methyltransferase [Candidatus Woesearchaeota archaeon]MBW3016611.1 class I SAM-dependent methyltransferase [Candidatus Woesearchaeota archaeon]